MQSAANSSGHTHWAACQGTCSCSGCTVPGPQCGWPCAESSPPAESEGHTHTHTAHLTPHTPHERPHPLSLYLELFLEATSASLSLHLQSVEGDPQVGCHHLCVPAQHQLAQGVMDEDVLGLGGDWSLMPAPCGSTAWHTCVCTSFMRWPRRPPRNWCTLRLPSDLICCIMASRRMKVPVRPTPALQCTSSGWSRLGGWSLRTRQMKLMRDMAFCGTPWSGQAV